MKRCTFWEKDVSRQCKLTYIRVHEKPLHSERQFIAARYVLNHKVLFLYARSQQ